MHCKLSYPMDDRDTSICFDSFIVHPVSKGEGNSIEGWKTAQRERKLFKGTGSFQGEREPTQGMGEKVFREATFHVTLFRVVFFTSAKCRIPSYLLRLITLDYYVQSAVVCMLDTGAVESNFGIFREQ